MKKIIVLLVVLFVIIFANCYLSAQSFPSVPTNALKEINEFEVLVEPLPDEFTKIGLTTSEFQTIAELFLRANDIKVVDKESAEWDTPVLYININIIPLEYGGRVIGYAYDVGTELTLSVETKKYGTLFGVPILQPADALGYASTINYVREDIKTCIRQDLEKIANQYLKAHQEKIEE